MPKLKSNLEQPIVIRKKIKDADWYQSKEWLRKRKKKKEEESLQRMYRRQQGKRSR